MSRIDLQVPITEKDAAKHLGARWDSQNKTWYVSDGIDATPLQKWIAVPESPNIRAEQWFLATTTRECWRCHASSRVFGIVLPEDRSHLPPSLPCNGGNAEHQSGATDTWRRVHVSTDTPELPGRTQGQKMIESVLLKDAAWALETLGQGDDPGYAGIHSGIAALDALLEDPPSSLLSKLDLMAAAQCLLTQATEGEVPFNMADREHASALARMLWGCTPNGF